MKLGLKHIFYASLITTFCAISTEHILSFTASATEFDSTRLLSPTYVLGAGDQVRVDVFGHEEFSGEKVILPDGTITLPLFGEINAAGRTLPQLTEDIAVQMRVMLVNPIVTVSLVTMRPVAVTITGEVQRPGPVLLQSLTSVETATTNSDAALEAMPVLSAALMEAGGLTSHADIRNVRISRLHPNGEVITASINLWDAIWNEQMNTDPMLIDGDAVFVPRLEEADPLERRLLARSSLAPEFIRVRVVGEVRTPGEITIPPTSTISAAVASAGGPTEDASLRRVEFVRLNENGVIERQHVDLRNLVDFLHVEEGDVIFVPRRRTFSGIDFFSRMLLPFSSLINLIQRF
ncbi:MAG: polysaccharide biosynthesis/export family protein [Leptolyngbyaceae bacterium]|nr:polysaccharide biosynthesis/export family protein [Leptolyngbyaceae bacterium]